MGDITRLFPLNSIDRLPHAPCIYNICFICLTVNLNDRKKKEKKKKKKEMLTNTAEQRHAAKLILVTSLPFVNHQDRTCVSENSRSQTGN